MPPGENSWWHNEPLKNWINNTLGYNMGYPPLLLIKTVGGLLRTHKRPLHLPIPAANQNQKDHFLEGEPSLIIYCQGYRFDSIPHIDLITSAPCESTAVTVSRMAMDQLFFDIQFNRIPRLFSPKPLLASHLAIWAMPEKKITHVRRSVLRPLVSSGCTT